MKCQQCGFENILKANYCKKCGNSFSEQEKETAYQKTIYGKIEKLENAKAWLDLSKITGNLFFRLGVLAILLVLVLSNVMRNGRHLAIQSSDQYTIAYAKELDEYYLQTSLSEVDVTFYLPREAERLTIRITENGALISENTVDPEQGITLPRRTDGYYTLTADYTDNSSEQLLFFVCEEDGK